MDLVSIYRQRKSFLWIPTVGKKWTDFKIMEGLQVHYKISLLPLLHFLYENVGYDGYVNYL